MPHMCTKCGKIYEDSSEALLHGCECGWNKFLYLRSADEGRRKTVLEYVREREKELEKIDERIEEVRETESIPPEGKVMKLEDSESDDVASIRIIEPGRYELNLNALFERDEIIMALKRDGTYVIHFPSIFKKKKF
ncbi:MAG: uncharacterized protein PWR13_171 [Archaeoglobi archaeon]|nr:uncharacterized protein [Archaeoglobi archaeon]MDK2781143.1 uncharacterized protein [Archaeoglobi archaeon]